MAAVLSSPMEACLVHWRARLSSSIPRIVATISASYTVCRVDGPRYSCSTCGATVF